MQKKGKTIYKFLSFLFIIVCVFCVGSLFACSDNNSAENNEEPEVVGECVFEGLSDIKIGESETKYNFKRGVSCKDENGVSLGFSVDVKNVVFGTAGKYEAIYKCRGNSEKRTVYIYGKPMVRVVNSDISYIDMANGNIGEYVNATDTFGESVSVSLNGNPNITSTGALATGSQNVSVIATDEFGNVRTETVRLNVLPSTDNFSFQIPTIDMSRAYYSVNIGSRKVKSVYFGTNKADETMYAANGSYLGITPALIKALGAGSDKRVYFNFDTCSVQVALSITDNESANYIINGEIDGGDFWFDQKIELPIVTLSTASAQNVEFKKYIEHDGVKIPYDGIVYDPMTVYTGNTDYAYIVEIYKNGEKESELREKFTVKNECYYLQNFATAEYKGLFSYDADNASLTVDSRSDSDKVLALKFYKPSADGTYQTALNNGLILDADLIANAKAVGYTRLQFMYKTVKEPDDAASLQLRVYREENGKYKGTELLYFQPQPTEWRNGTIDLSAISDGQGLIFINNGTTLYLANLTFKGKDYGIIDFSVNFAKDEYAGYLWERNNVYATDISTKEVIKGTLSTLITEKDESKTNITGGYTYWGNYSLGINEQLILSAVKAGKTQMTVWYATEAYSDSIDKSGALVLYKCSKGFIYSNSTLYIDNYANRGWRQVTIDISGFVSGDTVVFNTYGTKIYICGLTFSFGNEAVPYNPYSAGGISKPYLLHLADYIFTDGFSDVIPYLVDTENGEPYLVFKSANSDPYMDDIFDD